MNIEQALNLRNTLSKIIEDNKEKLSPKASFILMKNYSMLLNETKEYEQVKQSLFTKFGEQVDEQHMRIKEEHINEFMNEMAKFDNVEVDCKLRTLTETETIESGLNAIEMLQLQEQGIIEEEKEEKDSSTTEN